MHRKGRLESGRKQSHSKRPVDTTRQSNPVSLIGNHYESHSAVVYRPNLPLPLALIAFPCKIPPSRHLVQGCAALERYQFAWPGPQRMRTDDRCGRREYSVRTQRRQRRGTRHTSVRTTTHNGRMGAAFGPVASAGRSGMHKQLTKGGRSENTRLFSMFASDAESNAPLKVAMGEQAVAHLPSPNQFACLAGKHGCS
jgi:hypothetical protein